MTVALGSEKEKYATKQIDHVEKKASKRRKVDKLPDFEATLEKNMHTKKAMARELASIGLTGKAIERVLNLRQRTEKKRSS